MKRREITGIYVDVDAMEFALKNRVCSIDSIVYYGVVPAIIETYNAACLENGNSPDSGAMRVTEKSYPLQERWERQRVLEIEPQSPISEEMHRIVLKLLQEKYETWEGVGLLKSGGQGKIEKIAEHP